MNKFTKQWSNATENFTTVLNTVASLTNNSLENAQKIATLQCEAASTFIKQSANATKDLLNAKTPAQASSVMKDFASSSLETSLAKSKEILNVLSKSQASLKEMADSSFKNASDTLLNSIDRVSGINPAWSKAASESLQQLIDSANQANQTLEKVSKQVSSIASKNVDSVAEATLNNLKKSSASKNFSAK